MPVSFPSATRVAAPAPRRVLMLACLVGAALCLPAALAAPLHEPGRDSAEQQLRQAIDALDTLNRAGERQRSARSTAGVRPGTVPGAAVPEGLVFLRSAGGRSCVGTLIAPRWIVTTGHCAAPLASATGTLRVDRVSFVTWETPGQVLGAGLVKTVTVAPSFQSNPMRDDLALIQLFAPMLAPTATLVEAAPRVGTPVAMTGWPRFSSTSKAAFPQTIHTTVHDATECEYLHGQPAGQHLIGFTGHFLCLAPQDTVCVDEHGAPVFYRDNNRTYLVGLALIDAARIAKEVGGTTGNTCATHNAILPVGAHNDWIMDTVCGVTGDSPLCAPGLVAGDEDADGVPDDEDRCMGTLPEDHLFAEPSPNAYIYSATPRPAGACTKVEISNALGCSCTQMLAALPKSSRARNYNKRHGCSVDTVFRFLAYHEADSDATLDAISARCRTL